MDLTAASPTETARWSIDVQREARQRLDALNTELWALPKAIAAAQQDGDELNTRRLDRRLREVCREITPLLREWGEEQVRKSGH